MLLELQNTILEMIARGEGLKATVDRLCLDVESMVPDMVCSVLQVDAGGRLRALSGPSLAPGFSAAIDGLKVGPLVGSCGTAAYLARPVIVDDIETDPRWHDYKDLARSLSFKACWSTPIFNGGRVVGTFAFYYFANRGPSELEQAIVDACVHLCSIAIEREERVRERDRLTYTDTLTNLPNRARFNAVLGAFARDRLALWGVLLIDIDNLKLVNDTFGHAAGDDLIRIVAHRIAGAVEPDTTYRLGGDEFAVLVRAAENLDIAQVAEEIIAAAKDPIDCGGQVIFPAVTIGGAIAGPNDSPDIARQNADFALYDAKERSRGRYVEFHPQMGTSITKRFRAIRDVNLALAEERIDAFYQPIVRLDTGEVVGFEALCRMFTPSGRVIAASAFHEATKDGRVAAQLTDTMLRKVARDVRSWLDDGLPFQHVGINLAAADFHIGGVHERIRNAFDAVGVPLKHIILEVTESVYLGRRDQAVAEEIQALRAIGMRVALDDFGTGYASLTHLLSLPVDIIKIDKSFVDRLVPGDKGLIIIEGLLGIAEKLGIRVVAEGIETSFQIRQLAALGCLLGQGYYFSEAVDRQEARRLLEQFGQRIDGMANVAAEATSFSPLHRVG